MESEKKPQKKRFSTHSLAHKFKTLALIGGFLFDLWVLPPINTGKFWWVGPIYIGLVLICVLMRQIFRRFINYGTWFLFYDLHNFLYQFFSFFTSFFLGSVLAYSLIYYSSLSDIFSVWPLFLIILIAIILNETLKDKIFDISIFMLAINFYFILNTPIFLGEVSNSSFYLSLIIAFVFNFFIIQLLKFIYYEPAHNFLYLMFLFLLPLMIYSLYYFKYLPAVPLKLNDANFYSYIEKVNDEYYKEEIKKNIIKNFFFLKDIQIDKKNLSDNQLYFFSAILSPRNAKIKSLVTHNWEKYNVKNKNWEEKLVVNFPIYGDREGGYRGYSVKNNLEPGEWRVKVLADERIIGIKKVFIR